MKKLLLLLLVSFSFACKKKGDAILTKNYWILESATIKPAITIDGKTSTNYLMLSGSGSCIANNFTYSFMENGIYTVSSNGSLCDMVANSNSQKWIQNGDQITIMNQYALNATFTLSGQYLVQKGTMQKDGVNHEISYIYKAKSK
jgi:hypothetical protein